MFDYGNIQLKIHSIKKINLRYKSVVNRYAKDTNVHYKFILVVIWIIEEWSGKYKKEKM